ncbi:MAG: BACON domain-containing protein [Prevotella sp.]|nr:BACON domain-containing protein [Prevotella sp.]
MLTTIQRNLVPVMVFIAALLIGCIADEVGGVYLITKETDTLHAVADQKTDIMFNAGGEWTAKALDNWLEVSPETGKEGRNIITVRSTKQNCTKQLRKARVIITSDGKSKTIEVVQRDDYAFFDSNEYVLDADGGEINMPFTTNVEKGKLYITYYKLNWCFIADSEDKTRTEEWSGSVKHITVMPNETTEARSTRFTLGIYDEKKNFMALDSTWVRQGGISTP